MRCEEACREILDATLEQGTISPSSPLGRHLQRCGSCRSLLARLARVDSSLRAMPLESAPARVSRRILEQVRSAPDKPFLPWMVWLPVLSLLFGLTLVYLTLFWPRVPEIVPVLTSWPARFETWLSSHQDLLGTVGLSIAMGLLFSFIGIGLGLYVGRARAPAGR